jgi:hypothetical protein
MDLPTPAESAEVAGAPRKRRRMPTWLRVSVAVGLCLVVLLVVGSVWLVGSFKRMFDPSAQWPAIRQVIAVDEPPPAYDVFGMPKMDEIEAWGISDKARPLFAMLVHLSGDRADRARKGLLAPEPGELLGEWFDPVVPVETGTIVVQGRELRCLRSRYLDRRDRTESKKDRSGPAILVDLSREDSDEFLGCMMVLEGQSGRVGDDSAVAFLKPFHVGPDR